MTRKKKGAALTGRQIEHLLRGDCLLDGEQPFDSDEERKEAWFKNRDFLLSLEGVEKVVGVFGRFPLPKGEKPEAMKRYEKGGRRDE